MVTGWKKSRNNSTSTQNTHSRPMTKPLRWIVDWAGLFSLRTRHSNNPHAAARPNASSCTSAASCAQLNVCQTPNAFSRNAGACGRRAAWSSKSLGKVVKPVSVAQARARVCAVHSAQDFDAHLSVRRQFTGLHGPELSRMADAPLPLRQRARRPTLAELDAIPWLKLLDGGQRERAVLAETAYTVLRSKTRLEALARAGSGALSRRLAILAYPTSNPSDADFLQGALLPHEKNWLQDCRKVDGAELLDTHKHNLPVWLATSLRKTFTEQCGGDSTRGSRRRRSRA